MIPAVEPMLKLDFTVQEQPSLTFRLDMQMDMHNEPRVIGYVDELDAIRQAIYKILSTERYKYLIYSWNYGIELADLFGKPVDYVCPELERRISEALLQDSRIKAVTDFSFDTSRRGQVLVKFLVHTGLGELEIAKEVAI